MRVCLRDCVIADFQRTKIRAGPVLGKRDRRGVIAANSGSVQIDPRPEV